MAGPFSRYFQNEKEKKTERERERKREKKKEKREREKERKRKKTKFCVPEHSIKRWQNLGKLKKKINRELNDRQTE